MKNKKKLIAIAICTALSAAVAVFAPKLLKTKRRDRYAGRVSY